MPHPTAVLPELHSRPRRVLVTGGAGLIGSALVWGLNRHGIDDIVVVDRLGTDDRWRNLVALRFADYLEAEALLPSLESGALGRFDLVLHLGANSNTMERDVSSLIHNNFEYTKRLALWAVAHETRFVYASSAATYGDLADDVEASNDLAVLRQLRPLNAYGYSKHLFDLYAAQAGLLDRVIGLKYFNVFGPNEAHKGEMRSLVHKAHQQILDTGRVKLFKSHRPEFTDGGQRRDFLYVKDAVAMTLHLATASGVAGLYNVGSGVAQTWLELVGAIFAAMDRPPEVEFIDMPAAIRDKYQYHTRASIAGLRRSGYTVEVTPLTESVRDYVQRYLQPDRRLGDGPER